MDPMLGASGHAGSIWIPLANKLANISGKKIILSTFGIGGTSIKRWADHEDLGYFYDQNILSLKQKYNSINFFIWIQGEADIGMSPLAYGEGLRKLINKTKLEFPASKFMLSATTYCGGLDNAQINAEQKNVAKTMADVFLLGDTDKFSELKFRYDNCHLSGVGVEAITLEFIKSFHSHF
jgi:hypothetical protein